VFKKISNPINATFVKRLLALKEISKDILKRFMKTRRNTNVVCASIHVSNTVLSEPTLSVFMMESNHINVAFVKGVLVKKDL
jgi:hypothetical protein